MLKDQKDLAEFFEVEELESRLEMDCWAGCADGCCGSGDCVCNSDGACNIDAACNVDGVCVPVNSSCGGGGGGGE